jgi:4-hydroxythreonine-4-phosphate dehydrogenase
MRPRIALSIGDPSGIGPEIALRVAAEPAIRTRCDLILVGDAAVLRRHAACMGLDLRASGTKLVLPGVEVGFRPVPIGAAPEIGTVSAAAGRATLAFLTEAVALARRGAADAVVAAPHNETAVNAAGVRFAGYGGWLATHLGVPPERVFLMLAAPRLRVVHVSLHLNLRDAVAAVTRDSVLVTIRAAHAAARQLGHASPRIGVAGLNPHAGEGGLFGQEDATSIAPAVAAARAEGIDAEGPVGADVLLPAGRHDVCVAMYHDQGHVAVKMLAPRGAAALSIGLPILFSSVAHGTAHDIAGKGCADPSALRTAVETILEARESGVARHPDLRHDPASHEGAGANAEDRCRTLPAGPQ